MITHAPTHFYKASFLEFYKSERSETLMQDDFSKARSMGANAFPSIVKIDEGYKNLEEISTLLV